MLRLEPLGAADLPRMAHITVASEQIKFSGTVQEAFATREPDVDFHGVFEGGRAVGFFKIDRTFHTRYPFAAPQDLGLRAFIIDRARQGQGIGSATSAALPTYLRGQYPDTQFVWLTVNFANPAARRAYLKGGFIDTGEVWPYGEAGPQNILRIAL